MTASCSGGATSSERIEEVAPFLRYDSDPYIVITDEGELYWFLDAYTVSNRFPYSEPYRGFNYIRNPVKVVTNAYDGSMTFYVVDEDPSPLRLPISQIFPALFKSFDRDAGELEEQHSLPQRLFLGAGRCLSAPIT